jgi:hypothetical protein
MSKDPIPELKLIRHRSYGEASKRMELPWTGLHFDLASRAGNSIRTFKHLHQVCLLNSLHFARANLVKLVHLLDMYLGLAQAENPLGIYTAARSVLELHALVDWVHLQLTTGTEVTDVERAEKFLAVLRRARFGSSQRANQERLAKAGMPADEVKPFQVLSCIDKVGAKVPGFDWLRPHYEMLCDFVHHNGPSQLVAARDVAMSKVARFGRGAILLPESSPVMAYEIGGRVHFQAALSATAEKALESVKRTESLLMAFPETPFSPAEVFEKSGTRAGMPALLPTGPSPKRAGRNEPCSCGSGKKYKHCHGAH